MKVLVILEITDVDGLIDMQSFANNEPNNIGHCVEREIREMCPYFDTVEIIEPDDIDPNDSDLGNKIRKQLK